MTDNERLAQEIEDGLAQFRPMFAADVIAKGKNLLDESSRIYGHATSEITADHVAQDYIYRLVGVSYPGTPVLPQHHAAAKLMSLAIGLATSPASTDILAEAVKQIGVLGQRLVTERALARDQQNEQREEMTAREPYGDHGDPKLDTPNPGKDHGYDGYHPGPEGENRTLAHDVLDAHARDLDERNNEPGAPSQATRMMQQPNAMPKDSVTIPQFLKRQA